MIAGGYSQATVSKNIETERNAGRSAEQAAAIAYSAARKAWRKKHPTGPYPRHLQMKRRKKNPVQDIEHRIASKFVTLALKAGLSISVFDSEETVLKNSRNKAAIMGAMFSTDDDTLVLHKGGEHIGSVWFIWGNGEDCISDWSWRRGDEAAEKLIDRLATEAYESQQRGRNPARKRKSKPMATKRKTKKRRTPAQIAATKKLVALNKKRRGKKKTSKRRNPSRKGLATRSRKKASETKTRDYVVFRCVPGGSTVAYVKAFMPRKGFLVTFERREALHWTEKKQAEKAARYVRSITKTDTVVGVASNTATKAEILAFASGKA